MKTHRLILKSILHTLYIGANNAALLPGNFVAVSPENKLTSIPWGAENLRRVIEQLLDIAELRVGSLEEMENAEILELRRALSEQQKKTYELQDRLDRLRSELENF